MSRRRRRKRGIIWPLGNTKGELPSCITPSNIFRLNIGHRVVQNICMWLTNNIGRRWRLGKSGLSPEFQVTYLNQLIKFSRICIEMYRKPHLLVPPRLPQYINYSSPSYFVSHIAYVVTFVASSTKKYHLYATNILLVQDFLKSNTI
jgi:hypothetical protein